MKDQLMRTAKALLANDTRKGRP